MQQEEVPSTPTEKPAGEKRKRDRRKAKVDWGVVRRTLSYAIPYRAQIITALLIGMFSALLTAGSLLMLIPILQLIFDNHASTRMMRADESGQLHRIPPEEAMWREDNLTRVEQRIERLHIRRDQSTALIERTQLFIEIRAQHIRKAWYQWVLSVEERAIYYMAALLIIAAIIKGGLEFISKYLLQKCFFLAVVRLKSDLYDRCLNLDLPHFRKFTSGDLISRLNNDIRAVRTVFTTMMSEAVLAPFSIIFLLLILFYLNWALTLIVIFGLPPIIFPMA